MNEYRLCICCNGKGKVMVKKPVNQITFDQKGKILALYKKGFGIREIQRKLNIKHPGSVSYYIKSANRRVYKK